MTTAFSGRQDLAERRRAAEKRIQDAGGALAARLGKPWRPPKRQWNLEAWRCDLLEQVAELLEAAASGTDNQ